MPESLISYYLIDDSILSVFKNLVQKNYRFVILPHTKADGDALGSAFGLKHFLEGLGKIAEIVCVDEPFCVRKEFLGFRIREASFDPEVIISVDTASLDRLYFPQEWAGKPFINIDHHKSNPLFGSINIVDGSAPSNAEMLAAILIKCFGLSKLGKECCDAFLYGIISDTITFRTGATSAATLKVAAALIEQGELDFYKIKRSEKIKQSPELFRIWNERIGSGLFDFEDRVFFVFITNEFFLKTGLSAKDFDGLSNFLSQNLDVEIVVYVREDSPGEFKVSLRSEVYDLRILTSKFGGGGHAAAAGVTLFRTTKDDVISLLRAEFVNIYNL